MPLRPRVLIEGQSGMVPCGPEFGTLYSKILRRIGASGAKLAKTFRFEGYVSPKECLQADLIFKSKCV